MNKVELVGRIVRDPVISENGKTARFNIAVQRNYKNKDGKYEADFPSCVAFGKTVDIIEKYFKKGSSIGIVGRVNTGSYTNKEGSKVYTTDIAVENVEFVGSKAENAKEESLPTTTTADDSFMNIPDTVGDMPFGG